MHMLQVFFQTFRPSLHTAQGHLRACAQGASHTRVQSKGNFRRLKAAMKPPQERSVCSTSLAQVPMQVWMHV